MAQVSSFNVKKNGNTKLVKVYSSFEDVSTDYLTVKNNGVNAYVCSVLTSESSKAGDKLTDMKFLRDNVSYNICTEPFGGGLYGVEWDGSSNPQWTRTDDALGFVDPNPYYSGMSGNPSSPFDNISPWKDMTIVDMGNLGKFVKIPKFYYKWGPNGNGQKLQISMSPFSGSFVSPAHMDRGDGKGERDVIYVGRYHCADDYTSKSGVKPLNRTTRNAARQGIHNLGNNVWQWDYATWKTIQMLYLVEFAYWNCQLKIGHGCSVVKDVLMNSGYTDNMPYHTGTTATSRNIRSGTQYRNIEGLWDNVYDCIDGIYLKSGKIFIIKNPNNYNDTTGGVEIGSFIGFGNQQKWAFPTLNGYEFASYCSKSSGDFFDSYTTYICDSVNIGDWTQIVFVGGYFRANDINDGVNDGLFYLDSNYTTFDGYDHKGLGSRICIL